TALEHCGGVDFLVCVAGVNPLVGSTLGASEQVWDKILDVNVKSPALLLSQLLPHMENRGCVTEGLVAFPFQKLGVYNTSKTALLGLCKSLAVELAPKGIRVNCLVPGIIKTEFSHFRESRKQTRRIHFWIGQDFSFSDVPPSNIILPFNITWPSFYVVSLRNILPFFSTYFEKTNIFPLPVLEVRSLRSRCQQG
uniref:Dehydrogenase/reductase 2 n=1 Tax=Ursus americanus TaxID=9643 RepID=A0A452QM51_URSAM